MTDAEVSEVFGDGTKTVYVEITAKDIKYPRQEFSCVPLALTAQRVPIDNKTLKYGTDGKLKVEVPAWPSSDSVLTIDGQGKFNWEPFTASQNGRALSRWHAVVPERISALLVALGST